MSGKKKKAIFRRVLTFIRDYCIFFLTVAFVVTCSFLVFFSSVTLTEEDIRAFAPVVFFNVLVLTALFMVSDMLRRRYMMDRPAAEISRVLHKLQKGDFTARVPDMANKDDSFREIAAGINMLAQELGSVETLRTDFIANVSHEMKTPLAVMQNYGTLLQSPDLSEEKRLEYAKAVTDSSRRLADMMTNILKLNRLENQQIYPQAEEYDLGEQLCECLLQYESVWEREGIEIDTDIAESVTSMRTLSYSVWCEIISFPMLLSSPSGAVRCRYL